MSTLQVGARLVRRFGEGKSLKTVVTETLNGKTFTKVLDSNRETILNRVKGVDRYDVGNKKVSTITKIMQRKNNPIFNKVTVDRVYDGESRLLGIRRTVFEDMGDGYPKFVKKSTTKRSMAENRAIQKDFEYGIAKSRTVFINNYISLTLPHNNKGLPIPYYTLRSMEDMTLAQMRRWSVKHQPQLPYAPEQFRLGNLDKQDEVIGTINNLDRFF